REVYPLGSVLVAGARVDLHAAKPLERHPVEGSQRIVFQDEQRERLVTNQPAGQLGGEGHPETFRPPEGDVEASCEQLTQGSAQSSAETDGELEVRCRRACVVD